MTTNSKILEIYTYSNENTDVSKTFVMWNIRYVEHPLLKTPVHYELSFIYETRT